MSLGNAMFAAFSGMFAQAANISYIADNVANANTPGYKKVEARFQTVVMSSSAQANVHAAGGVTVTPFFSNRTQGPLQQSASPTSVAVSGDGYLPVSKAVGRDNTGQPIFEGTGYYTRLGDFQPNADGYLVNSSGYYLNAWRVDPATGEIDTSHTEQARISNLLDAPVPTGMVEYDANLPSNALNGAGGLPATLPPSSIQIFDTLGNARILNLTWMRIADNSWTLTVASPDSTPPSLGPATVDFGGALGGGTAPGGTISALSSGGGLTATPGNSANDDAAFSFALDFGSGSQTLRLDLGAYGSNQGMTQYAGDRLTLNDFKQNGVPQGNFKSFAIDDDGFVTVTFDNGNIKRFYQVPVATFRDPNELDRVSGNAFVATPGSGNAVLKQPGSAGAGDLVSAAIEGSNVDIAEEFAKLIVAQRSYSANARIISIVDELMQETLNIAR